MPLLRLADGAADVGGAVVDQRRRPHLLDLVERRHRVVAVARVPPERPELELGEVVTRVRRAGHADEIADHPAGDRGGEAVVAARQVARHVTAVAVARDREPLRVGDAFGDELVERLEEVLRVGLSPGADRGVVEVRAVPVAAAGVEQQHGEAASRELLVVEMPVRRRRRSRRCAARRGCRAGAERATARRACGSSQPCTTVPSEIVNSRSSRW